MTVKLLRDASSGGTYTLHGATAMGSVIAMASGTTASPSHKPKPKLSIRLEEVGLDELADAVVAAEKRHGVSSIVLLRDYALGRTAHDDPDTEDWVDELLLFFSEPRIRRLVCDADESA